MAARGVFTGVPPWVPGQAGATAPVFLAGGTAAGAPVAGPHRVGEIVEDNTGAIWLCTVAGTPGTWKGVKPASVTAADIQSAAMGGVGIAGTVANNAPAAADHRHPVQMAYFEPPANWICQTMPRGSAVAATVAVASGTIQVARVTIPGGVPLTNHIFEFGTTGSAATTHWWGGFADAARVVQAITADQLATVIVASTEVAVPYTAPFTPAATMQGYYFVCAVGTVPTFQGFATGNGTILGETPAVCGRSSVAQTVPPALLSQIAGITQNLNYIWGGIT